MRKLLLLPPDGPRSSGLGAEKAFGQSIVISGIRCLISYVIIPLLGAGLGFSSGIGPVIGLVIGFVSMVAIFFAMRRFFGSDHRFRWRYAAVAGAIFVLLIVQAVVDIAALAS